MTQALVGSVITSMNADPNEKRVVGLATGGYTLKLINDQAELEKTDAEFLADPSVPQASKDRHQELRAIASSKLIKMSSM